MFSRKKIVAWASVVIFLFASGLWFWSPQAYVDEKLSAKDLVLLRLAIRAHTFQPIYEIDTEGNDMASVTAGEKPPWARADKSFTAYSESGKAFYTCYYFHRTKYSWKFSDSPPPVPVDFGRDAPTSAFPIALQITELIGISVLALVWCLKKESRRRIRVGIYTWLVFLLFSASWCLLIPTRYLNDFNGRRISDDSYSYYGMIAMLAFTVGWSLPSVIVGISNWLNQLFGNFKRRRNLLP